MNKTSNETGASGLIAGVSGAPSVPHLVTRLLGGYGQAQGEVTRPDGSTATVWLRDADPRTYGEAQMTADAERIWAEHGPDFNKPIMSLGSHILDRFGGTKLNETTKKAVYGILAPLIGRIFGAYGGIDPNLANRFKQRMIAHRIAGATPQQQIAEAQYAKNMLYRKLGFNPDGTAGARILPKNAPQYASFTAPTSGYKV